MAARSKVRAAKIEPLEDKDFAALEEEDDSSAEELHALIEREKKDFISLDEYLKRRGIDWEQGASLEPFPAGGSATISS